MRGSCFFIELEAVCFLLPKDGLVPGSVDLETGVGA
jgi:hypothetical protein